MIKKEELFGLEDDLVNKLYERELDKIEKQLIKDNNKSKEVCEYLMDYEIDGTICNKNSKKKLLDLINQQLAEANFNFEFKNDVYFIMINDKIELVGPEKDLYFAFTSISKKAIRKIKKFADIIDNKLNKI